MINLTSVWGQSPTLLSKLYSAGAVFASGNRLVQVSGWDSAFALHSDILTSRLHGDGTIEPWVVAGALPAGLSYIASGSNDDSQAYGVYLVCFGGSTTGNNSGAVDTISILSVNNDGSVSIRNDHWPFGKIDAANTVLASNGWLYVIGGANQASSYNTNVYRAKIQGDGHIGPWIVENVLPLANGITFAKPVEINGCLVFAGGFDSAGAFKKDIWSARINSDGSLMPWVKVGALAGPRIGHGCVKFGDTMVVVGGSSDGSTLLTTVEMFRVLNDGSVVPQGVHPSALPLGVQYISEQCLVKNGTLHVFGGMGTGFANIATIQTLQLKF